MTRKYKRLSNIFYLLATLCFIIPLIIFGIIAYQGISEHKTLLICGVGAALLFLIDLFRHGKYRMSTWLLLLGLVTCASMQIVQLAVSITTVGVILDDMIFTPLHMHYKKLYIINREIDKRQPKEEPKGE